MQHCLQQELQSPVYCSCFELFRVEVTAYPLQHPLVLLVARVGDRLKKVFVPRRTATVLWRAGTGSSRTPGSFLR